MLDELKTLQQRVKTEQEEREKLMAQVRRKRRLMRIEE